MDPIHLEIIPYVGDNPLSLSEPDQHIEVSPAFKKHMLAAISRSQRLSVVTDRNQDSVTSALGEFKAFTDQIESAKKAAKAPYLAIGSGIENAARSLLEPILAETKRLKDLLIGYASRKQFERDEALRAAEEAKAAREEAERTELARLENERQVLEYQRRHSETLEEDRVVREQLRLKESQIKDQSLSLAFAESAQVEAPIFTEPLVRGTPFRLEPEVVLAVDGLRTMIESGLEPAMREGLREQLDLGFNLVRRFIKVQLRLADAKSEIRRQLDEHENDPAFHPSIPGLEVKLFKRPVIRSATPVGEK
jgi:hypothetical protein